MTLLLGDCVERMRELPEASVDAVVCDPPYGLEFMGKEWDRLAPSDRARMDGDRRYRVGERGGAYERAGVKYVVAGREMQDWHEAWAREALRVLKPGGHLLAFGGTRTYHRLAAGLEDAGFEIRDTLAWMYGSGFPKSLDVSKAIDKANGRLPDEQAKLAAHIRERRLSAGVIHDEMNERLGYREIAKNYERTDKYGARVPSMRDWRILRPWLGLSDEFLPLIERVEAEREVIGRVAGVGAPLASYGGGWGPEYDETIPATDEARRWQGWGTALKPAFEPVVVARKPLIGTVAANVLAHGVGAINVDACRIATGDALGGGAETGTTAGQKGVEGWTRPWMDDEEARDAHAARVRENVARAEMLGRWPANVVLGHSPDCVPGGVEVGTVGHAWECVGDCPVGLLDEQTGDVGAAAPVRGTEPSAPTNGIYGDFGRLPGTFYGDGGGASRFFYTAKTSRAERNAGLDGFEPQFAPTMGNGIGGKEHDPETATPKLNSHPTVKPIELMRWLLRLVVPPGGRILDPFLGSGTTGCAAALEGLDFVGVELDPDYLRIAEARIAFWREYGEDGLRVVAERAAGERVRAERAATGQLDLLSG